MSQISKAKLLVVLILGTTLMHAQTLHTWISSNGDDSNPCSATLPCRTFAAALAKTDAGGEIDAKDPANFGTVMITKAITIDGKGLASIIANRTNGIIVKARSNDIVILRNLSINGMKDSNSPGLNGVRFISGKDLNVENCFVSGFLNNGIDIVLTADGSSAHIINSVIKNVNGAGITATTTTGQVQVGIDNSQIMLTQSGAVAGDHSRMTISRSFIEHASSAGVQATSGSGDSVATVRDTELSYNGNGVLAGPGGASINVGFSQLAWNTTAFGVSGGVNYSHGNNEVHGNGSDGTFSAASPGLR